MRFWVFYKKLHIVWCITATNIGVVCGIFVAPYLNAHWLAQGVWVVLGVLLTALFWWRARAYMLCGMILAGGLIGLWRGTGELLKLQPYQTLEGREVVVKGVIQDDPSKKEQGTSLHVGKVEVAGQLLPGSVWVALRSEKFQLQRSGAITLRGTLSEGFGSFAASMYNAQIEKVERAQLSDIGLEVRTWFSANVRQVMPAPEADLALGFLTGEHSSLPPQLDESLRVAGLTHIVVASGYNLTILVNAARRLFGRASRYGAALLGSGMIIGFMGITGLSPSMARAGLVAGLSLGAWYYGRKFHPVVLLSLAAAITLLVTPSYAWGDLGWQLSFSAFIGVLIVAPLFQAYFFGKKKPSVLRQIAGETVAAWLCTLPILVAAFGSFSNVAIFANLLVVPFIPVVMVMTFICGMTVFILPFASFIGMCTSLVVLYMIHIAQWLADLEWASTALTVPWQGILLYCALLAGAVIYLSFSVRKMQRQEIDDT